jgi:hypothetical protein
VVLLAVRWHVKPWFAARAALIGWLVVAAGMLIRAGENQPQSGVHDHTKSGVQGHGIASRDANSRGNRQ